MEPLRAIAKRALSSYDRYQPELKFSTCMMKYARKQYPEMMRQIRMRNIGKIGYNMYTAVRELLTNAMNDGESMVERGRIGTKVAQMTRHRPTRMGSTSRAQQQRQSAGTRRRPQINFTSGRLNRNVTRAMMLASVAMTNRSIVDYATAADEPRHSSKKKRSLDTEPILFVGPRQFPSNPPPSPMQEPMNEDDDIDLANKPPGEIVENLFDWEPIVLEGFGIDPKSIEKFSPMYCSKEYFFSFIKRFVHDFILA